MRTLSLIVFVCLLTTMGARSQILSFDLPFDEGEFTAALDELLENDGDAALLAHHLLSEYLERFRHEAALASTRISAAGRELGARQKAADPTMLVPYDDHLREETAWIATSRTLWRQLVDDVAVVIPRDRVADWRLAARRLPRPRILDHAAQQYGLAWRIDHRDTLREIGIDLAAPTLKPVMEAYESALDAALDAYADHAHALFRHYAEQSGWANRVRSEDGHAEAVRLFDLWEVYPRAVEDAILAGYDAIGNALSEADAARFRDATMRRMFPGVFTPSPIEFIQPHLESIASLTDSDREELNRILAVYAEQERVVRQQLVEMFVRWESLPERRSRREALARIRKDGGDTVEVFRASPALPLWEAQNRLVITTLPSIAEVLGKYPPADLPIPVRVVLGAAK